MKIFGKFKKILFWGFGAFFIICFGVAIYLNSILDPLTLKNYTKQRVQAVFPDTTLDIGEVDLSVLTSLSFQAKNFKVSKNDSVKERPLFHASQIKINIPLFSLITGGGNIDVTCEKPELYIGKDLWRIDRSIYKPSQVSASIPTKELSQLVLPSFIAGSTFDVRANKLKVHFVKEEVRPRIMMFEKFVLKNFGLNTNAAFELKSKINKNILGLETHFNLVNIGSFSILDYLSSGILSVSSSYKITDLSLNSLPAIRRVIHGGFSAQLGASGILKGTVSSLAERSKLGFSFIWSDASVAIRDIKGEIVFSEFSEWISELRAFNLHEAALKLGGSVKLNNKSYQPKLNLELSNLKQGLGEASLNHNIEAEITTSQVKMKTTSSGLGGQAAGELEGDFDLMSDSSIDNRIKFFTGNLKVQGMKIEKDIIRKIYSSLNSFFTLKKPFFLMPKGELKVAISDSSFQGESLDVLADILVSASQINVKKLKLSTKNGEADYHSKIDFFKDNIQIKSKLEMKGFNLANWVNLFPSSRPAVIGITTGSIVESYGISKNQLWDIVVKDGAIKNVAVEKDLMDFRGFLEEIPSLSDALGKNRKILNNKFKRLHIKSSLNKDKLKLFKLFFISIDGKLRLEGSGSLRKEKSNSLKLFLVDDYGLSRKWKSLTGNSKIPLRLKLTKNGLLLDRNYTLKKLASSVLKERGKTFSQKLLKRERAIVLRTQGKKIAASIFKGIYK